MKKILFLLLFFIMLNAYDINKLSELVVRDNTIYKKFETVPYTGLGKIMLTEKNKCMIIMGAFEKGKPNGLMEFWDCNGSLLQKGKVVGKHRIGLYEIWNKEGIKIESLTYDEQGKIVSGFSKRFFPDSNELFQSFTYKSGKKSGWELSFEDNATKEFKVIYENDKIVKKIEIED